MAYFTYRVESQCIIIWWPSSKHDATGESGAQHLGHDVHDCLEHTDLAAGEHSQGHGGIQVGSADMP